MRSFFLFDSIQQSMVQSQKPEWLRPSGFFFFNGMAGALPFNPSLCLLPCNIRFAAKASNCEDSSPPGTMFAPFILGEVEMFRCRSVYSLPWQQIFVMRQIAFKI